MINTIVACLAALDAIGTGLLAVGSILDCPDTRGAQAISAMAAALLLVVPCGKHVRHQVYTCCTTRLIEGRVGQELVLYCNILATWGLFIIRKHAILGEGHILMYSNYFPSKSFCSQVLG